MAAKTARRTSASTSGGHWIEKFIERNRLACVRCRCRRDKFVAAVQAARGAANSSGGHPTHIGLKTLATAGESIACTTTENRIVPFSSDTSTRNSGDFPALFLRDRARRIRQSGGKSNEAWSAPHRGRASSAESRIWFDALDHARAAMLSLHRRVRSRDLKAAISRSTPDIQITAVGTSPVIPGFGFRAFGEYRSGKSL